MRENIYAETQLSLQRQILCSASFQNNQSPILGVSRDRAISRLLQVEQRLAANKYLHDEYSKCMEEYIKLEHMKPISKSKAQHRVTLPNGSVTQTCYYLQHHAVEKPESTTTKVRVVFDASSKSSNGKSLNDALLNGPVLQDNLFGLLLRWRRFRIVIKAAIERCIVKYLLAKYTNHISALFGEITLKTPYKIINCEL